MNLRRPGRRVKFFNIAVRGNDSQMTSRSVDWVVPVPIQTLTDNLNKRRARSLARRSSEDLKRLSKETIHSIKMQLRLTGCPQQNSDSRSASRSWSAIIGHKNSVDRPCDAMYADLRLGPLLPTPRTDDETLTTRLDQRQTTQPFIPRT